MSEKISIDSTWSSLFIIFACEKKVFQLNQLQSFHTRSMRYWKFIKKYFQVAIQNLIIILFHLLYSHSFTRHINKYSVKTKERNVIFERKYLTNWIFLFFFFTLKIYKNIKNVNEWIYLHTNKRKKKKRIGEFSHMDCIHWYSLALHIYLTMGEWAMFRVQL